MTVFNSHHVFVFLVVVDVSDKESIELAGVWKKDITNHAVVSKTRIEKTKQGSKVVTDYENADPSTIPILLLGNKMDVVRGFFFWFAGP